MNKKISYKIMYILLAAVLLAGCGSQLPGPAPTTPSQDSIATEVANIQTATAFAQPPVDLSSTATQQVVEQTATSAPTLEPTATLAPTAPPTSAPTATAGPTATAVKDDPRTILGGSTFSDKTFKENANWGRAWEDDYTRGEFEDNQLVLTSIGVDGWTVSWPKVKDFYIEMTATTDECSGSDRYGIIVRVPETFDRGYMAGFTCDGRFSLRYWDPEEENYVYLINWTKSDHINDGSHQTNRIGLWVEGDSFKVYANGHLLAEATDSMLEEEGRFGPWIGHAESDDFTIYISEVSYWALP